jgi:hypothetical protein
MELAVFEMGLSPPKRSLKFWVYEPAERIGGKLVPLRAIFTGVA